MKIVVDCGIYTWYNIDQLEINVSAQLRNISMANNLTATLIRTMPSQLEDRTMENEFTVEHLRVWYCMTFDEYVEATGFNLAGDYASSKWSAFQRNMAGEICNYSEFTIRNLITFANLKISFYNK